MAEALQEVQECVGDICLASTPADVKLEGKEGKEGEVELESAKIAKTSVSDNHDGSDHPPGTTPTKDSGDLETASTPIDNTAAKNKKKEKPQQQSSSVIHKIHTQRDLDTLLQKSEDASVVIVEFVTTWCGACQGIAPLWEELAAQNREEVTCAQVICDKNKETKKLAQAHGIQSYPVFKVLDPNGDSMIQTWNGADRGKLEKVFDKWGGGSGGGKKGGGKKKKGRR